MTFLTEGVDTLEREFTKREKELETELAAQAEAKTKAAAKAQPFLSENPDELEQRLGAGIESAPVGDFQIRPEELLTRFAGGVVEGAVNPAIALYEEFNELGLKLSDVLSRRAFRGERATRPEPIPPFKILEGLEESQTIQEANFLEDIAQRTGGIVGFLAPFSTASKLVLAKGFARYIAEGMALGGLAIAESRREERVSGESFPIQQHLAVGAMAAAAIPGGAAVGMLSTKLAERVIGRSLHGAIKEIVNNTAIGAAFEGGAALYEGVDLTSKEGAGMVAAGIVGFNFSSLFSSLFTRGMVPRTLKAKQRAVEITTKIGLEMDLGIPQQRGSGISPESWDIARTEFATNWYRNVVTPVLGDANVTVRPEALSVLFDLPIQTANRIVREKFNPHEVRFDKFQQAQVQIAREQMGPDAATEVLFRQGALDPITESAWKRRRAEQYTPEQLEAFVPPETLLPEILLGQQAAELKANLDGFGFGNRRVREANALAQEAAVNRDLEGLTSEIPQPFPPEQVAGLIEYKPAAPTPFDFSLGRRQSTQFSTGQVTDLPNRLATADARVKEALEAVRGAKRGTRKQEILSEQLAEARNELDAAKAEAADPRGRAGEPATIDPRLGLTVQDRPPRALIEDRSGIQLGPSDIVRPDPRQGGPKFETLTSGTTGPGRSVPKSLRDVRRPGEELPRRPSGKRPKHKELPLPERVKLVNSKGKALGVDVVSETVGPITRDRLKLTGALTQGAARLRPVFATPKIYETLAGAKIGLRALRKQTKGRDLVVVEVDGRFRVAELKRFGGGGKPRELEVGKPKAKEVKPSPPEKTTDVSRESIPEKPVEPSVIPRAEPPKQQARTAEETELLRKFALDNEAKLKVRLAEEATAADKKSNQPLKRFERETGEFISDNPNMTLLEVRKALGDVTAKESRAFQGISKAFLGERQHFRERRLEDPSRGKTRRKKFERKHVFEERARGQSLGRFIRENVDPAQLGGQERKDVFIQELGVFDRFMEVQRANVKEITAINKKFKAGEITKESAETQKAELRREIEEARLPLSAEEGALSKVETDADRRMRDFFEAVDDLSAKDVFETKPTAPKPQTPEAVKRQAEKPRIGPIEGKLPILLLGAASGAAVVVQRSELSDEEKAAILAAGMFILPGKLRRGRKLPPPKTKNETAVERWVAKTGERNLRENSDADTFETVKDFNETLKATKPSKAQQERMSDEIADAERLSAIRELEQLGLVPEGTVPRPAPTPEPTGIGVVIKKSVILGETVIPALRWIREAFGPHGRALWAGLNNDFVVPAQKLKTRVANIAREAGEVSVVVDGVKKVTDFRLGEELSSVRTPKQIQSNVKLSDKDNFNELQLELHMKWMRPREIDQAVENIDRLIQGTTSEARLKVLREMREAHLKEKTENENLTFQEPNNDRVAVQTLGAYAYARGTSPRAVADFLGWKPSEIVLKGAERRRKLESTTYKMALKRAQDAGLPTLMWTLGGAYAPVRILKSVNPNSTFDSVFRPSKFQRDLELSNRYHKIIADNIVYRRNLADKPVTKDEAMKWVKDAAVEKDNPFAQPSYEKLGKKQANLDFHRQLDTVVGIERDFGTLLRQYVNPVIDRIHYAEAFGPDGRVAKDLINKAIVEDRVNGDALIRLHDFVTGGLTRLQQGHRSRILREMSGFVGGILLAGSGPAQITSYARVLFEAKPSTLMKAILPTTQAQIAQSTTLPQWFREKFGSKKWRRFVAEVGPMTQNESLYAMMEMGGFFPRVTGVLLKTIYATVPLDRWGRNFGAIVGRFSSEEWLVQNQKLIQNGQSRKAEKEIWPFLKEMYGEDSNMLDLALSGNYTPPEMRQLIRQGGHVVSNRASGRTLRGDMPLNYEHPTIGPIYKLSVFTTRMSEESYRHFDPKDPSSVLRNPRTINRWLAAMVATFGLTQGVIQFKRLIAGHDPETVLQMMEGTRPIHTLAYMGFAPVLLDLFEIVPGKYGPLEGQVTGPVYSTVFETLGRFGQAAAGRDAEIAFRAIVNTTPQGWWNLLGVPNRREIRESLFPRRRKKKRQSKVIPP